ncbi:MAG: hypothetical protein ACTSRO_12015 [Candidatus Heimdallarchaeaceae archaeon]
MNEIVEQFLEKEYQEVTKTHQLLSLFGRYKNMSSEMVEKYLKEYSKPELQVISALYTSDYILTSSEVKIEMEDEIRRKEIMDFWGEVSLTSEEKWYDFTYLIAFIYKIASILRKRYYYLLDRGVAKHIAAALVSDYYSRHVIRFSKQKMPSIPFWWITLLFETAMCQTVFSTTKEKWKSKKTILHSEKEGIVAQIIGNHFIKESEEEPNPAVPIPYFAESTLFFYITWGNEGGKKYRFESLLPSMKATQLVKEFKKSLHIIDSDSPHILKYLRLTCKVEDNPAASNLFIVHAKSVNAEGWIGLLSPIDDINLQEVEALLKMKIEDIYHLEQFKNELQTIEILQRKIEEREIVEEEIKAEEKGKTGFLNKLLSLFKRKKKVTQSKVVKRIQPIDSWARAFLDELLIASVSGLRAGEEVYDTYREDTFIISGIIESEQKETKPTIFYSETSISFPSEFLDPIINFIEIAKSFIPAGLNQKVNFEDKSEIELVRLVEFVMGEKLLVGILAEKQQKSVMTYARDEPTYQRRSLLRKANEILTARRVNDIYDIGKRILSREIDWNSIKESYEKKPLFFMK